MYRIESHSRINGRDCAPPSGRLSTLYVGLFQREEDLYPERPSVRIRNNGREELVTHHTGYKERNGKKDRYEDPGLIGTRLVQEDQRVYKAVYSRSGRVV
jgi:hypothetical protein